MKPSTTFLSFAIATALAASAHVPAAQPATPGAVTRAKALLDANPSAAHRNAGDTFSVRDVMVDPNGTEHVRMDRTYRGLPVFGGDVVVHSRNGKLSSVSHTVRSSVRPSLDARVDAAEAVEAAGAAFGPGYERIPTLRKVLYARHMAPILAWEVQLQGVDTDGALRDMSYFVDATTGKLLLGVSNIYSAMDGRVSAAAKDSGRCQPAKNQPIVNLTPGLAAIGTGHSLFNGSVVLNTTTTSTGYGLSDSTRGSSVTRNANKAVLSEAAALSTPFIDADNIWGNGTECDPATVAADVHYGAASAWDYFLQVFERLGVRNDGAGTTRYVHVDRRLANAYWYAGAMYFGDGNNNFHPMVSLDIVGHEMSHGVMQATARLVYSGESGGVSEANADIFGTMVEHFANNPNDVPDYTIGELVLIKKPMRYLYKPSLNGYSPDCYSAEVASMGPHSASGPGGHFFYLLAEGAVAPANTGLSPADLVCNGNTGLGGIGRDAAQRIWYQALTHYMTSNTSYAGARSATLQAAVDLFGAGSAQQQAVAAAWSAVGVN